MGRYIEGESREQIRIEPLCFDEMMKSKGKQRNKKAYKARNAKRPVLKSF